MSGPVKPLLLPSLLVAGFAALSLTWLLSTPPGAAPDEPAALIKALGAGRGELLGEKPRFAEPPASDLAALNRPLSRVYSIPADLAPPLLFGCNAYRPETPASCTGPRARGITDLGLPPAEERNEPRGGLVERRSDLGTYQPFVFVAPGIAARLGSSPESANRLARLASALLCFALVALAIFLLWAPGGGALPLLGLLVALTPMTVFVWSASLTGSGPEIAGGICTFAAILRLTRPGPAPRWIWLALAAGGLSLCGSRSLGPVLLAAQLSLAVILVGSGEARRRFREGGRAAVASGAVLAAACMGNLLWQLLVQPSRASDLGRFGHFLAHDLVDVYREMIGVFGWLDGRMNQWMYFVWILVFVGLLALSFAAGRGRQRLALGAALALPLAVGGVAAMFFNPEVARVQGRWLLPVAAAAPMLAGEILWRARDRAPSIRLDWVVAGSAVLLAGVQLEGWYAGARRQAVGVLGPHDFFTKDVANLWSPPLGWIPWLIVACAGAGAIAAFGLLALRDAPGRRSAQ